MALSGQKTVTTAGTEVVLGTQEINGPVLIKALPTNTGLVYVGNDGANAVSSSTGFPLAAGDLHCFEFIHLLSEIYVDSAVNGEGVAWSAMIGEDEMARRSFSGKGGTGYKRPE